MRNILLEISANDPATSTTTVLRACSAHAGPDGTYLDGKEWLPVIVSGPQFEISYWSDGQPNALNISYGSIGFLISADTGSNVWPKYSFEGQTATVWVGEFGDAFTAYRKIWTGALGPLDRNSDTMGTLPLLGPEAALNKPVLSDTYGGTGGADGTSALMGTYKPYAIGACTNIAPVLIDPAKWVYQAHGYGACPINGVYESAYPVDIVATVSTYAQLIALTIPAGKAAVAPAVGMFRLANEPTGKISADVGTSSTVGATVSTLMQKVGLNASRIDASVTNTARAYSLYITSQEQAITLVRDAAFAGGRYLIADGAGKFFLAPFVSTKTPTTLTADRSTLPLVQPDKIAQETPASPAYKVRIGHTRVWSTHSTNEISPALATLAADQAALDARAQAAQDAADQAQADANLALARYNAMVADGVLDRPEKIGLIREFEAITAERAGLISTASGLGVSTTAYATAYSDLSAYLTGLTPAYVDTTQDTPIDGATFTAKFNGYRTAKQALVNASANAAATRANWTSVASRPTNLTALNSAEGTKLTGIETGATKGAPTGTNVGSKPVADVIDAITTAQGELIKSRQLAADIATANQTAADLQTTYGSTASAAASANAAEQHKNNAQTAASNADTARQQAQAALAAANGAKTDSEAARNAAEAAKTASELARGQSQTYASNSESSLQASDAAKTASQSARDQAQQYASNANGSAQAAAGSASTANTKATEAGQSASAALASEVSARSTVAALLPTDFSQGWTYWGAEWSTGQGTPLPAWSLVDTSYGRVARLNNPSGSYDIANAGRIAVSAGRKLRITVKWRVLDTMGIVPEIELYRIGIPGVAGVEFNNNAKLSGIVEGATGWGDNNGFATATYDINTDDFVNNDPRSAFMRVLVRISRKGVYDIQSIRLDDVTSEQAAKSSAEAAASSQSAASISEGKAGQSASAANTSQTNAATHESAAWDHRVAAAGHESAAQTYRNESSQSASNAAGSASTAQQQAGLASGSANQAGQSASAAAGSASTASSKANDASQSASAAQASSVSASTVAQSLMPSTFGDPKNWSNDWGTASGDISTDTRFNAYDHGTYGRILDVYNAPHFSPHIVPKGRIALVRDKVYRITVKWALTGNQLGSPVNATLFAIGIRPNSAATGDYWNNTNTGISIAEGQAGWGNFWATHSIDVHSNALIDNGCAWTRPLFRIDSQGHYAVQSIEMRDVTAETNAAGSASAAATSESAASIYKNGAEQSASASAQSATNANTRADDAWQYRGQAETFRNEASNSASNAAGSASTASQQAGLAAGSANQAGQSAGAAAGSASGAASSASQAGQSASAAQTAEVSATTAAQSMMPNNFTTMKNWTWDYRTGTGDLSGDNRFPAYDHGTLGRLVEVRNNPHFTPHIAPKGRIVLTRDRTYRITVRWCLVGQQNGDQPVNAAIFAIGIKPDQSDWNNINMGVSSAPGQAGWGGGNWATHSIDVNANTLLDQGCGWTRPLFRLDSQGVFFVQTIDIRDVTAEINAAGSANAAAGSASTASIKAGEAGQSASAANTSNTNAATHESAAWDHRVAASGHESAAWTYRNEASQSASNASGSASTASQQAGLASNSANAAGQSAGAAAGSASTASSKANEASQSANAASSSQVTASNAANGAQQQFANTFPNFVGPIGKSAYVYMGDNGDGFSWENGPDQGWPQPYITAQGPYQGGQYNRISFKESVKKVAGRRYRVTGWFYTHGNNCAIVSLWALTTNNNNWDGNASSRGTDNTPPGCVNNIAINSPGFNKFGMEFTVGQDWPSMWKPIFEFQTTGGTPNGLWHMTGLTIEDITSERAAADSASAASNSYSNAQYEAGLAGQRAEAASGSANTASIKAGEAQGSANAASGSAAQASGSASAASSSANLAATFSTGGGNLLPETTFAIGTQGWNSYSPHGNYALEWARDIAGDDWRPTNEHGISIRQSDGDTGRWSQWHSDQVSVTGSTWYEFSAYSGAHRCNTYIRVDWVDANGNGISSNYSNPNNASAQGGRDINAWFRNWGKVQSPWNAARAHVVLVKDPTLPGNSDSYGFFCRPMLRQTYEQASGPSPYSAGTGALEAASQQASISTNASAIATTNSTLANLTTVVQSGSPNLLRNGGFQTGMNYWSATHSGWNPHVSGGWGQITDRAGDWSGDHCYMDSERVPVFGNATYTFSADSLYYLYSGSGHCYTELVWYDGAGNWITQHSGNVYGASHDYSTTGVGRNQHKLTATSPGNATTVSARLVHYKTSGSSVNVIGWRQAKLEQGSVMTPYSNEAAVTTISETVTSVDGKANSALARAAVRLDVNGYVTGWETNNNGGYGNMVINADNFAIQKPGGGARTEYSNGCWKVFDQNGVVRARFGNLSA